MEELIEECTSFPNAAHDDQVDALTQALNRLYGVSSAVYPIAESEILVEPFEIQGHCPRAFAVDIRWNRVGVLWAAMDPATGIVYVYSEYWQENTQPAVHAQGILSQGKWIVGVSDLVLEGRSESDRWRLLQMYRDLGVDLEVAENCVESGTAEVLQALSSGRLKVFRTLSRFSQEYRMYRYDTQGQVVKQDDLLMNCLRSLWVSGRARMSTEPTPVEDYNWSAIPPGHPGAWMA